MGDAAGLSTSAIQRLETGSGASSILTLHRFADALGMRLRDLMDFEIPENAASRPRSRISVLPWDHPRARHEAYRTLLPLYSLEAAAGHFGAGEEVRPEGWIELGKRASLERGMFVARALGSSMLPKIHDGDYLVFRANPEGTRRGKIVLAQYRGPADPDTGGSYAVKLYDSAKIAGRDGTWRHEQITLSPLNPEYQPIVLTPKDAGAFRIVAEYLFSLPLS